MTCDWCGNEGSIPIQGSRDDHVDGFPGGPSTTYFAACQDCFDTGAYKELNPTQVRERAERKVRAEAEAKRIFESDVYPGPYLRALFGGPVPDSPRKEKG